MATTDDILAAARDLGKLISEHAAAKKFENTVKRLQNDIEAQRVLNDYNRHLQKLGEKEANGQPIEVEDKRQLEKLQTAVIRNPLLRDFQMSQMDYLDLMRRVDESIQGVSEQDAAPQGIASSPLVNPDLG